MVSLFIEHYPALRHGDYQRSDQGSDEGTLHYRRDLDPASEVHLDGEYTARQLLNLLRARTFAPHPGCWFVDGDKRYEVRVEITEVETEDPPGPGESPG